MENVDKGAFQKKTADFYNNNGVWNQNDFWHLKTHEKIQTIANKYLKSISPESKLRILNAGSGGIDYGLSGEVTHLDIAEDKIKNFPKYIISSIESIDVESQSFDMVFCVGSVLNYCDPVPAINEFARVLSPNGYLILEFELSTSAEYRKSLFYNQAIEFVDTFYQNKKTSIWVYSYPFIKNIINKNGLKVIRREYFHTFSAIAFRITKKEKFSSAFISFDWLNTCLPFTKGLSCNIMLKCQKLPTP